MGQRRKGRVAQFSFEDSGVCMAYRSSIRYKVFRSTPRISAVRFLFPPVELRTRARCRRMTSSSDRGSMASAAPIRSPYPEGDLGRQIIGEQDRMAAHRHRSLDGVLQFSDIAGPGVGLQARHGLGRDSTDGFPIGLAVLPQKWLARTGMSSRRSRSAGRWMPTTFSR